MTDSIDNTNHSQHANWISTEQPTKKASMTDALGNNALRKRRTLIAKSSNRTDQIKALALRMDAMEQRVGNVLNIVVDQQDQLNQVLSAQGLLPTSQVARGRRPESLDQLVKRIGPELSVQQAVQVQQLIKALGAVQAQLAQQATLDQQALRALFVTLDQQVRRQILALLDPQAIRDRLGPQAA
jgi:hypothetical protein